MDRLPKHNELMFRRVRKTLFLQLTTVIRSLATKFDPLYREQVSGCANRLKEIADIGQICKSKQPVYMHCVYADISWTAVLYQTFLNYGSGDGRRTKKLRAGIARLEFLRDNWDDLEITGDLKRGYELVRKSDKS